ncbi:hypothetical protein D3C78_1653050 [compost metagenome]
MAGGVQLQIGDAQGAGLQLLVVAAQQAADTGQQFRELERFEQVIVGPQVQALDPVGQAAVGGKHHDARGRFGAQPLQHGPAIEFG